MDARKIQFLIGIQREIDKLEAKDGNTPKIERVKSRFYDVVEVEDMVSVGNQVEQNTDKDSIMSMPEAGGDITAVSTKIQRRKYTPEEIKNSQDKLVQLLEERGMHKLDEVNTGIGETAIVISSSEITQEVPIQSISRRRPIGITESSLNSVFFGTIAEETEEEPEKKSPHKPKDVAAFLVRFRDRKNRGLKYLTHRWSDMKRDQPLTYNEVVTNARKELQECRKQYEIPNTLYYKILEYVASKTSEEIRNGYLNKHPHFFYSVVESGRVVRKDVYAGWSGSEMIEWVKNNPNSDPNQDDYWKKKLIQPFKQAIEVRDGMFENYMRMNAEAVLMADYQRFNPVYGSSLKEARFFTDVPILFEGIRNLLAIAKDKAKEPTLRFEYHIPDSTDMYGIRQIKIVTDRNPDIGSSTITKADLIKGGDFGVAYDNFYGLCNWSIICKRGVEFVKINLLTDIDELPEIDSIDETEVDGFTHILTFYDL